MIGEHKLAAATWIVAALPLVAGAGCVGDLDDDGPQVSEASSEINGRYVHDTDATPFAAGLIERATFYSRAIVASTAFSQCVANTMTAQYLACDMEPNWNQSMSTKITRAVDMLRTFNNRVFQSFDPTASTASAAYQGYATYDQHTINHGRQYFESYANWGGYGTTPGREFEPWNWYVGTQIHEFAHSHDYRHICSCSDNGDGGAGCKAGAPGVADCADQSCSWTTTCGGSGTPPSGTTWSNVGEAQQEYCAWYWRGDDSTYYARGEPSLPYILGSCAGSVVVESHEQCGKATASGCGDGELRVLSSWTGTAGTDQTSTSCTCIEDPRHLLALKTHAGNLATVAGGGNAELRTDVANTRGPWQTFFAIDTNGGNWLNWDTVQIQSFDSQWLDANFEARATTPTGLRFQIGSPALSAGARVNPGLWAHLYRWNFGDGTGRYAFDNGAELTPASPPLGDSDFELQLDEYRRERLVYLGGHHGNYVNVSDSSMYLFNTTAPTTLSSYSTSSATTAAKRRSAFWLIDHDGAPLEDGDTVSFEVFRDDVWHYLSTRYSTLHMRAHHSIGAHEKFVVNKRRGTAGAVVADGDVITLRAADGMWVSAMPSSSAYELRKGGAWEGPWQEFSLRYVDQLDRARATW